MKLFDLHCDTALSLYRHSARLADNSLHISLRHAAVYERYIQVAAVWSRSDLGNEAAWESFFPVADTLDAEIAQTPDACRVQSFSIEHGESSKYTFLLAVEDARILNGYIRRLDILRQRGVRILTLLWSGHTVIGGSHDTDAPLTPFGREVVRRCFEIGMVPDVSHASHAVTAEVLSVARDAGCPVIASHSNSAAVFPHSRNLTDSEFSAIRDMGGLVGISLAPQHLAAGTVGIRDVVRHISHYLSLGGEKTVCLGCDFDGIGNTPEGLENLASLPRLAEALLAEGLTPDTVHRIFYENAYGFAIRHLL